MESLFPPDYSYASYRQLHHLPSAGMGKWDALGLLDINVFPRHEDICDYGDHAGNNESDMITVGGHGNPESMIDSNGNPISPAALADIIKSNPKFDGSKPILLASCNTGSTPNNGGDNYAQQLANELGVTVYAPNNFVWYNPNGKTNLGNRCCCPTSDIGNYLPHYPTSTPP